MLEQRFSFKDKAREKIWGELCLLSSKIIEQTTPFDDFKIINSQNSQFGHLKANFENIENDFKIEFVNFLKDNAKWSLYFSLSDMRVGTFYDYFPNHLKTYDKVIEWINNVQNIKRPHLNELDPLKLLLKEKFSFGKFAVFKKNINDHLGFKLYKNESNELKIFKNPDFRGLTLALIFKKTEFEFLFGAENPKFFVKIGDFLGGATAIAYDDSTLEDLLQDSLEQVRILTPHIFAAINS